MPIMQALAAAVLWAMGTVLGRYMGRKLEFQHYPSLRFFFGLIASGVPLPIIGAKAFAGLHDSLCIALPRHHHRTLLAGLYYFGLKRTPAVIASLAELAYPAIAVIAGIYAYNSHLLLVAVARRGDHHRHGCPAADSAPAEDGVAPPCSAPATGAQPRLRVWRRSFVAGVRWASRLQGRRELR